MDPDACLRDMLDALRDEDRVTAMQQLDYLRDWLARGGFMPRDPRSKHDD